MGAMKMNRISKRIAAAAISAFLFTSVSHAGEKYQLDLSGGSGAVEFTAIGRPKMLKIRGKGDKAQGKLMVDGGKVSGKVSFDLRTLDTGISLRNNHMKEKYLETKKHPKATLEITSIKLPSRMPASLSQDVPFVGKLTVKGKTQEVNGVAKLKRDGATMTGEVEFATTVQAFGIDLPSFAGVTMADEVNVKVEFSSPFQAESNLASKH